MAAALALVDIVALRPIALIDYEAFATGANRMIAMGLAEMTAASVVARTWIETFAVPSVDSELQVYRARACVASCGIYTRSLALMHLHPALIHINAALSIV
jgi:hypothetical protein